MNNRKPDSMDYLLLDKETDRKLAMEVMKAVREIRYGSVQITIHDSKVVQIDKTEKVRW